MYKQFGKFEYAYTIIMVDIILLIICSTYKVDDSYKL